MWVFVLKMEKMKTRLEQRSESDDDDDDVVRSLREQILTLEEKLEQEAKWLLCLQSMCLSLMTKQ